MADVDVVGISSPPTIIKSPRPISLLFLDEVMYGGRVAQLQSLLDKGGVEINMRHKDRSGNTCLLAACQTYRHDNRVIEFLIRNGASLSVENNDGFTALHLIQTHPSNKKTEAIIRTLLVHGICVHTMSNCGKIALHTAVIEGSTASVKLLLDYGADISDVDFVGHNALHLAAKRTHGTAGTKQAVMRLLLTHGTDAKFKLDCLSAELEVDSDFDPDSDENETFPFDAFDLAHIHDNNVIAEMLRVAKNQAEQECSSIRKGETARRLETRRANELALAMGQHKRLGESSAIMGLPVEVLQLIMQHAGDTGTGVM